MNVIHVGGQNMCTVMIQYVHSVFFNRVLQTCFLRRYFI